jgi:hypothetical protein
VTCNFFEVHPKICSCTHQMNNKQTESCKNQRKEQSNTN